MVNKQKQVVVDNKRMNVSKSADINAKDCIKLVSLRH